NAAFKNRQALRNLLGFGHASPGIGLLCQPYRKEDKETLENFLQSRYKALHEQGAGRNTEAWFYSCVFDKKLYPYIIQLVEVIMANCVVSFRPDMTVGDAKKSDDLVIAFVQKIKKDVVQDTVSGVRKMVDVLQQRLEKYKKIALDVFDAESRRRALRYLKKSAQEKAEFERDEKQKREEVLDPFEAAKKIITEARNLTPENCMHLIEQSKKRQMDLTDVLEKDYLILLARGLNLFRVHEHFMRYDELVNGEKYFRSLESLKARSPLVAYEQMALEQLLMYQDSSLFAVNRKQVYECLVRNALFNSDALIGIMVSSDGIWNMICSKHGLSLARLEGKAKKSSLVHMYDEVKKGLDSGIDENAVSKIVFRFEKEVSFVDSLALRNLKDLLEFSPLVIDQYVTAYIQVLYSDDKNRADDLVDAFAVLLALRGTEINTLKQKLQEEFMHVETIDDIVRVLQHAKAGIDDDQKKEDIDGAIHDLENYAPELMQGNIDQEMIDEVIGLIYQVIFESDQPGTLPFDDTIQMILEGKLAKLPAGKTVYDIFEEKCVYLDNIPDIIGALKAIRPLLPSEQKKKMVDDSIRLLEDYFLEIEENGPEVYEVEVAKNALDAIHDIIGKPRDERLFIDERLEEILAGQQLPVPGQKGVVKELLEEAQNIDDVIAAVEQLKNMLPEKKAVEVQALLNILRDAKTKGTRSDKVMENIIAILHGFFEKPLDKKMPFDVVIRYLVGQPGNDVKRYVEQIKKADTVQDVLRALVTLHESSKTYFLMSPLERRTSSNFPVYEELQFYQEGFDRSGVRHAKKETEIIQALGQLMEENSGKKVALDRVRQIFDDFFGTRPFSDRISTRLARALSTADIIYILGEEYHRAPKSVAGNITYLKDRLKNYDPKKPDALMPEFVPHVIELLHIIVGKKAKEAQPFDDQVIEALKHK
ncbi:MAG TPA: hypothetical protein VEK38_02365, partial [Candidatus Bathyarchaeia archaeon]|nr:hypothetical protein [Candidatus Bathyarchaeia archaeon]